MASQNQQPYKLPTGVYNSYPARPPAFSDVAGRNYVVSENPFVSGDLNPFLARDTRAIDNGLVQVTVDRAGNDYSSYSNYLLEPSHGQSRISGLPQDIGLRPFIPPVSDLATNYVQQPVRSDPWAVRPPPTVIRQLN